MNRPTELAQKLREPFMQMNAEPSYLEKLVLRIELSTLLDERTRNRCIEINRDMNDYSFMTAAGMSYIRQNQEYIIESIQKRLASQHIYCFPDEIKNILNMLDKRFLAADYQLIEMKAISYAPKSYQKKQQYTWRNGQAKTLVVDGIPMSFSKAAQRKGISRQALTKQLYKTCNQKA